jgi:UDP-4-amino-4,6-dideoxy-N-acetyl-beta-L-altrosamine N-acetyltransferase
MPLSRLTEPDLELILPWRNAPAVRRAMYTHHEISADEHHAWFKRIREDPSARWYLYQDAAGEPQGVVYFTAFDPAQKTAFWGFYAKPEALRGTGMRILHEALELGFGGLSLRKINGEVLAINTPSINLHKKVGFTQEGVFRAQHFDGTAPIDVIRLGMLASEWAEHRERLRARVAQLDALAAVHGAGPPPRKDPDPV